MERLLYAFFILLFVYVYASVPITIYSFYSGRSLNKKPLLKFKLFNNYFFGFGCFIGLTLFLSYGFNGVFFFIPHNLGEEVDGEWRSYRSIITHSTSAIVTWLLFLEVIKRFKTREKKQ